MIKKLLIIFIIILISLSLFSQNKSFYYTPEEENLLMIRVNIWGQVHNPHSILVPDGTDLITAISYAGGPTINANTSGVILLRANGEKVKCNINKYKSENDRKNNPILKPGDTVILKSNFLFKLTKSISFIYQTAVIVYTAFQIWNIWDTVIQE